MNKKGFISIPILIAIIVFVIAVSVVATGVVLYKQGRLKLTADVSESIIKEQSTLAPTIKPNLESPLTDEPDSTLDITPVPTPSPTPSPTPTPTPTPTPQPIQQPDNQTYQYKKTLMDRTVRNYALATTKSNYADELMAIIDDRINGLSSLISTNESIANRMAEGDLIKERVVGINELYRGDVEWSQLIKKSIATLKEADDFWAKYLSDIATQISQMNIISASQFEKTNNDLNAIENQLNDFSTKLEETMSHYVSEVAKNHKYYDDYLATTKLGIDYLIAHSGSSSPQVNYYSSLNTYTPPYIPSIKSVQCYFHFYGTSGMMECY